ncbi:MAG: PEP-CTERM sorting domain-containing protein [Rubrivivax sp.]
MPKANNTSNTTRAAAVALLLGTAAGTQALTISNTVTVAPGTVYTQPASVTLDITATGTLDAAPATTGTAIFLPGDVNNDGRLLAALGSEINGLSLYGNARNGGLIEAVTLNIGGSLRNNVGATVEAGSYSYAGLGPRTPVEAGRPLLGVGFAVLASGNVINSGAWASRGDASILGLFDNRGSFVSAPNVETLPAGGQPYTQLLRIGGPTFQQPQGQLFNAAGGVIELSRLSLLVNGGDIENRGLLRLNGATLQNDPLGWVHNVGGATLALDGGVLRLEAGGQRGLYNAGLIEMNGGLLDNRAEADFVNAASGTLNIGAVARYTQQNTFDNSGVVAVAGRFDGGTLRNGGVVAVLPGGSMAVDTLYNTNEVIVWEVSTMEVGLLHQDNGWLVVNGVFDGNLVLAGGVLGGNGRINGSVFLGGPPGPAQQPPHCNVLGVACFRPGASPGTMTIDGTLTMLEGAVLELEVERDASGQLVWDRVLAQSISFEAGSVIQLLLGAGVGSIGQDLELLHCSRGCSFAGASLEIVGGDVSLRFDKGGLVVVAVPEPGTWLMMVIGLAAFAGRAARLASRAVPRPRSRRPCPDFSNPGSSAR